MNRRRYHSYTDSIHSSQQQSHSNNDKNDVKTTRTTTTKKQPKDANNNNNNNNHKNDSNVIRMTTILMSIIWLYWNWFILHDGIVLEWNLYFGLIWYICDLLHFEYDTMMVVQIFSAFISILVCFVNEPSYIYSSCYACLTTLLTTTTTTTSTSTSPMYQSIPMVLSTSIFVSIPTFIHYNNVLSILLWCIIYLLVLLLLVRQLPSNEDQVWHRTIIQYLPITYYLILIRNQLSFDTDTLFEYGQNLLLLLMVPNILLSIYNQQQQQQSSSFRLTFVNYSWNWKQISCFMGIILIVHSKYMNQEQTYIQSFCCVACFICIGMSKYYYGYAMNDTNIYVDRFIGTLCAATTFGILAIASSLTDPSILFDICLGILLSFTLTLYVTSRMVRSLAVLYCSFL